jgi:hypothetical protein
MEVSKKIIAGLLVGALTLTDTSAYDRMSVENLQGYAGLQVKVDGKPTTLYIASGNS